MEMETHDCAHAQDRRVVSALLESFVTEDALRVGHAFSESGGYCVPEASDLKGFTAVIASYPTVPAPEVFGLHSNAQVC